MTYIKFWIIDGYQGSNRGVNVFDVVKTSTDVSATSAASTVGAGIRALAYSAGNVAVKIRESNGYLFNNDDDSVSDVAGVSATNEKRNPFFKQGVVDTKVWAEDFAVALKSNLDTQGGEYPSRFFIDASQTPLPWFHSTESTILFDAMRDDEDGTGRYSSERIYGHGTNTLEDLFDAQSSAVTSMDDGNGWDHSDNQAWSAWYTGMCYQAMDAAVEASFGAKLRATFTSAKVCHYQHGVDYDGTSGRNCVYDTARSFVHAEYASWWKWTCASSSDFSCPPIYGEDSYCPLGCFKETVSANPAVTFSGLNYNATTRHIEATGSTFSSYTAPTGDTSARKFDHVEITGGTAMTTGEYLIQTKTGNDIVLAAGQSLPTVTDGTVAGKVWTTTETLDARSKIECERVLADVNDSTTKTLIPFVPINGMKYAYPGGGSLVVNGKYVNPSGAGIVRSKQAFQDICSAMASEGGISECVVWEGTPAPPLGSSDWADFDDVVDGYIADS